MMALQCEIFWGEEFSLFYFTPPTNKNFTYRMWHYYLWAFIFMNIYYSQWNHKIKSRQQGWTEIFGQTIYIWYWYQSMSTDLTVLYTMVPQCFSTEYRSIRWGGIFTVNIFIVAFRSYFPSFPFQNIIYSCADKIDSWRGWGEKLYIYFQIKKPVLWYCPPSQDVHNIPPSGVRPGCSLQADPRHEQGRVQQATNTVSQLEVRTAGRLGPHAG